jgi:hypothetical protein
MRAHRGSVRQKMKHLEAGLAAVLILAAAHPVWAQGGYSDPNRWRYVSPTPEDAYRQGLISRWELQQTGVSLPAALQGPSPNGEKGTAYR